MSLTFHNPNKLIIYQVGNDTRAPLPCSHCEKQLYSLSLSLPSSSLSLPFILVLSCPLSPLSPAHSLLSPFPPSVSPPVCLSFCLCSLLVSPPLPPPYRFNFFLLLSLSLPFFISILLSHYISPQPQPPRPSTFHLSISLSVFLPLPVSLHNMHQNCNKVAITVL